MGLISAEFKKILSRKSVWIALLLLTLIEVGFVWQLDRNYGNFPQSDRFMRPAYRALYREIGEGEITPDKSDFVISEFNRLAKIALAGSYSIVYDPAMYTGYERADYYLFKEGFYNPMRWAFAYKRKNDPIVERAAENIVFFEAIGDVYQSRRNRLIAGAYGGRELTAFYDTAGFRELLLDRSCALLMMLFVVFSLAPLFSIETTTGMALILKTVERGRAATVRSKLLLAVGWILATEIVFSLVRLGATALFFGLHGAAYPLYGVVDLSYFRADFALSFFSGTIGEAVGIKTLLELLWLLFVGGIVLLVSRRVGKPFLSFLISFALGVGIYALGDLSVPTPFAFARWLIPTTLLDFSALFSRFDVANVFGFPVYSVVLLVSLTFLLTGVFFFFTAVSRSGMEGG